MNKKQKSLKELAIEFCKLAQKTQKEIMVREKPKPHK
jgi:hypothetical protein